MSTMTSPPQERSLYSKIQKEVPRTRTNSSATASSAPSSYATSLAPTPPTEIVPIPSHPAETSNSLVETIFTVLQTVHTTIWIYILLLESLARKYIEQYLQKGSKIVEDYEFEKKSVKKESVPEVTSRSRTGSNARELATGSGIKRKPLDTRRQESAVQSGSSSECSRQCSPKKKSAKGTGFDEPFCIFRNTTLPHPSADLSHNATISAPDIVEAKVHHHHRVRIPGRRSSNKNVSHGKILPGDIGYSGGNRLGSIATNESAMSSSMSGLYEPIPMENGTPEIVLTKTGTGLSGSTNVGSPVEPPIKEVEVPNGKTTQRFEKQRFETTPRIRTSSNSDWERETSKALERVMSPLSRHPVSINQNAASPKTASAEKLVPPKATDTDRPSTAPTLPIIKPGGFRRVSASGPSPLHVKKDSGIGLSRFETASRRSSKATLSGAEFVAVDSRSDDEGEVHSLRKNRDSRGILKKLKLKKAFQAVG